MASQNVVELANQLQKEFGIIVNPESYCTTRAGKHLRAGGAFLWHSYSDLGFVGGCEPLRKYIVKRNKLEISRGIFHEIEVYAYTPGEPGYRQENLNLI